MNDDGFIMPTTSSWQAIRTADEVDPTPPYRYSYPARLPDGRYLELPLRRMPGAPDRAVASLIANQAAFEVVRALTLHMVGLAQPLEVQWVVGLPTLGLAFAPAVAEGLGHARFMPLGYSRKYWYDDVPGVPVRSLTTPGQGKTLYIDPNLAPLVRGSRVAVVDDAISTAQTAIAAIDLLARLDVEVAGIVVAMTQGSAWRAALAARGEHWPARVHGVFGAPRFRASAAGWVPDAG